MNTSDWTIYFILHKSYTGTQLFSFFFSKQSCSTLEKYFYQVILQLEHWVAANVVQILY